MRNVAIKKGERFLILTYLGEGIYKVWYKGQLLQTHLDSPQFKTISDPKSVWCVGQVQLVSLCQFQFGKQVLWKHGSTEFPTWVNFNVYIACSIS